MSQPKFNTRAYGSSKSSSRLHRLIRPLFWEQRAQREAEIDRRRSDYFDKHYRRT